MVLSRVDNLASLHGFEAIILKFSGLLGDLFWIECELSNRLSDPIAAMNWPPTPILFQRLLAFNMGYIVGQIFPYRT